MHDSLTKLLWQLSEAGEPAVLFGRQQAPEADAAFQRLLALGVLVHGDRLTEWNACHDCDCGTDERDVRWRGDVPFAACPADNRRDEVLTKEDLVTFRVAIPVLVSETAAASGLGPPEEMAPGLWRMGRLPDGRVLVAAPTRAAMMLPGLVGVLRMVDHEGPIVLVGPRLPEVHRADLARQGIHLAAATEIIAPPGQGPLLGFDVARLPDGNAGRYRLVLTPATRTVWLDGREAVLRPRAFQLLHILVRQHRRGAPIVSRHEIYRELFSVETSDAAVRGLVTELRELLAKAFGAQTVSGLVETRTGLGYSLSLPPLAAWIDE
ncbi:winged helix-turn-helix domain-containing protein [Roseomonas mucosa]|uniref:winged helix-turn-helix domain-containing protein n=1 Tax=Roseomonas mucosa TaxID=207340 RepID=UPI0030CC11F0